MNLGEGSAKSLAGSQFPLHSQSFHVQFGPASELRHSFHPTLFLTQHGCDPPAVSRVEWKDWISSAPHAAVGIGAAAAENLVADAEAVGAAGVAGHALPDHAVRGAAHDLHGDQSVQRLETGLLPEVQIHPNLWETTQAWKVRVAFRPVPNLYALLRRPYLLQPEHVRLVAGKAEFPVISPLLLPEFALELGRTLSPTVHRSWNDSGGYRFLPCDIWGAEIRIYAGWFAVRPLAQEPKLVSALLLASPVFRFGRSSSFLIFLQTSSECA